MKLRSKLIRAKFTALQRWKINRWRSRGDSQCRELHNANLAARLANDSKSGSWSLSQFIKKLNRSSLKIVLTTSLAHQGLDGNRIQSLVECYLSRRFVHHRVCRRWFAVRCRHLVIIAWSCHRIWLHRRLVG